MSLLRQLIAAAALTSVVAATGSAVAQTFPSKPVRLIVPFPAGGTVDGLARSLQAELASVLGQPVVIDNKSGANGRLGTAEAVRAPADGYTIVMVYDNYATDPIIYKDLPYDPWKDLKSVSLLARAPMVAIASKAAPYTSMPELVSYAKANPGKVDFGSTGLGSSSHLTAELFAHSAGVKLFHIPYKGGAPAANDLLGGTLQTFWGTIPFAKTQDATGRVHLLAQTGATRAAALPSVPTLAELGMKDIQVYGWAGFMLPAGTPPAVVERWRSAISTAANNAQIRNKLSDQGFEVVASTPQEFETFLRSENRKWQQLISTAQIPLQ